MTTIARVGLLAAAMAGMSQLHRASLSALGPDIAVELGMSPAGLGAAGSAFFAALLAAQIPVGIFLDRIGPRRLVAGLSVLAIAGALAEAAAQSAGQLWAARFLVGLGCSASFMSAVLLSTRWQRGAAGTAMLARVFALSQGGLLLAGAPLAILALGLGWRGAMLCVAGLMTVILALWWWGVRDAPEPVPPRGETVWEALRGQFTVWATPGLGRLLSMHLVAYAAMATVLAVWAGPYLADVHGLDAAARGKVLLAMGLGLPVGLLVVPGVARRLGRRWTVVGGALATAACLALLALLPGLPLWGATALLVGLCLTSGYPVLVVTENRELFPDHMAGRAATTLNLAQVLGSAALPILVGLVVGWWPEGPAGRPDIAYRAGFGLLAVCLCLGAAGYARLPGRPPSN